jgi:hypothetical protein
MTKATKEENILRNVETAIWYWEEKLKGTKFWWDENDYSKEWIISQIKFFKEYKTQ